MGKIIRNGIEYASGLPDFKIQETTISVGTLSGGGEKYNQTATITKPSGCNTCLGVVGYNFVGNGFTRLFFNQLHVTGTTLTWGCRNADMSSTVGPVTLTVKTLWIP